MKNKTTTIPDNSQLERVMVTLPCPKCKALQAFEVFPDLKKNFRNCGHCEYIFTIDPHEIPQTC